MIISNKLTLYYNYMTSSSFNHALLEIFTNTTVLQFKKQKLFKYPTPSAAPA